MTKNEQISTHIQIYGPSALPHTHTIPHTNSTQHTLLPAYTTLPNTSSHNTTPTMLHTLFYFLTHLAHTTIDTHTNLVPVHKSDSHLTHPHRSKCPSLHRGRVEEGDGEGRGGEGEGKGKGMRR
jgi:hypothetical protein